MTKYKTTREKLANKFLNFNGEYEAEGFRAGADFSTRYWLTESEEVNGLLDAAKRVEYLKVTIDLLLTYLPPSDQRDIVIEDDTEKYRDIIIMRNAVKTFTKLIDSIGEDGDE